MFYIIGRSFLKREAVQRQGIRFGSCHVYVSFYLKTECRWKSKIAVEQVACTILFLAFIL
jgi:hypothetical protein